MSPAWPLLSAGRSRNPVEPLREQGTLAGRELGRLGQNGLERDGAADGPTPPVRFRRLLAGLVRGHGREYRLTGRFRERWVAVLLLSGDEGQDYARAGSVDHPRR